MPKNLIHGIRLKNSQNIGYEDKKRRVKRSNCIFPLKSARSFLFFQKLKAKKTKPQYLTRNGISSQSESGSRKEKQTDPIIEKRRHADLKN